MSASASEQTYETIKRTLMEGRLAFGPLDIGRLGDRMRVSATPVREALARLACERFVVFTPQQGYSYAPPSAALLKDLYGLSGDLLALALAGLPATQDRLRAPLSLTGAAPSQVIATTVCAIAAGQPNRELEDLIVRTSDRLHLARTFEEHLFRGVSQEAMRLAKLWEMQRIDALRIACERYFRRRVRKAAEIARLIADRPQSL